MDTLFLATKLRIPPQPHRTVRRARLIDALEHGIPRYKLVQIAAPAGYGKTTVKGDLPALERAMALLERLHQFAHDGVTLLGHLRGAEGDKVVLAPDLHENLAKIDQFEREVLTMIDGYIQEHGLDAPPEDVPQLRGGYEQPIVEELDLKAAGINTVIWAMGYTFDYSLVKLPVRDEDGFPIQTNGVSNYPGLYFVGLPWMPSERSGFLLGVGEAAQRIAANIAAADAIGKSAAQLGMR